MAKGAPPNSARSPTLSPDTLGGLAGRKILVVDDARDLCRLYQAILEASGAAVTFTTEGCYALELVSREEFDLVLMDLEMPTLSGTAAAREMRERGYQGLLIALSGHSDDGHIREAKAAGYSDYLCKDGEPLQLAQRLATYLLNQ
ncbi:MAG: response regulator [Deltaproteobacteria bacterium]|nr:response regulator [Deltaproteobacteria bacterium]